MALPVCMRVRTSKASSMVPKPPGKRATASASFTRMSLRVKKYLKVTSLGSAVIQGFGLLLEGQPDVEAEAPAPRRPLPGPLP